MDEQTRKVDDEAKPRESEATTAQEESPLIDPKRPIGKRVEDERDSAKTVGDPPGGGKR